MTSALKFTHNGHRYQLDGAACRGVTTIIKDGSPKPGLLNFYAEKAADWVANNPKEVAELKTKDPIERRSGKIVSAVAARAAKAPTEERDAAGRRGTYIHNAAEKLVRGEAVEVTEWVAEIQHYARWLGEWDIEGILVERPVGKRDPRYCGTFDLVGRSPKYLGGALTLLDLKTSRAVYGDTGMQCAAYAMADFYQDENGDDQPMPHIEATAVIHITPDGVIPYDLSRTRADIERAYGYFRNVYRVADETKARAALLGEPWAESAAPTEFYNTLKESA